MKAPTVTVETPGDRGSTTAPTTHRARSRVPPSKRLPLLRPSPAPPVLFPCPRLARGGSGPRPGKRSRQATRPRGRVSRPRRPLYGGGICIRRSADLGPLGLRRPLPAPAGAAGGAVSFTPQQIARLLRHGRARLDNPHVRAFVLGLEGCLTRIPPRLRTVLRLRTGVAERRPLSARAVAARLHISRKRLAALEVRRCARCHKAAARLGARAHGGHRRDSAGRLLGLPTSRGRGRGGRGRGRALLQGPSEPGPQSVPPAEAIPSPTLSVPQAPTPR